MLTTRPPSTHVPDLIPELAGQERTTVRLHPRAGTEPGPGATKLGGRIHWPAGEPWPRCDLEHLGADASPLHLPYSAPPDERPYVAVLQVLQRDVPELDFPPGTDTFQLLWCPETHDGLYGPTIRTFWRMAATLAPVVPPVPFPPLAGDVYVPRPCVLNPERVAEYPGYGELASEVRDRIAAWEQAQGNPAYQWGLSSAPGTKIGGYPFWFQDPEPQHCDAGHPMDHLLTISDTEFDGGTWHRWLPIEEAHVWDGPVASRFAAQEAAGLSFGMGSFYVFVCRVCAERPIRQVYQR